MATLSEKLQNILDGNSNQRIEEVDRRSAIQEIVDLYKAITPEVLSGVNFNTSEIADLRAKFLSGQNENFVDDIAALAQKLQNLLNSNTADRRRHFVDDMLATMANFSDKEIAAWFNFEKNMLSKLS